MVIAQVTRARNYIDDVEWSSEDGTRTEIDFLCRCVEAAIKAGATTINIPDTVGYTVPEEYFALIRMLIERVPNSDKAIFSVHCHDDLGMAVANSLAGIDARRAADRMHHQRHRRARRQRRAGRDRDGDPRAQRRLAVLDQDRHHHADARLEAGLGGDLVPGAVQQGDRRRNAFAHESGIHQDGMLKHTQTYEIMTPESVGVKKTSLVMGKHSGRHAFVHKLEEMGYKLADNQLEDAFVRFKALADRKKHVYDEDIEALVDEEIATAQDRIKLVSLTVIAGTRGRSAPP